MSLYKRNDSPYWWVKISHNGRTIQRSTGTNDKSQAQEYHDKLKVSLWEQQRLGIKPRRAWRRRSFAGSRKRRRRPRTRKTQEASLAGSVPGKLDARRNYPRCVDSIKAEKLKAAGKATVNRYLALVRAILLRSRDEWEWFDKVPKVKLFKEGPGRERSITAERRSAARRVAGTSARRRRICAGDGIAAVQRARSGVVRVDLEAGHAWVDADQSKNGRPIAVPLNATALEVLRRQLG